MANNYKAAVQKAKDAISEISKEVRALDEDIQRIVKVLNDYAKTKIPTETVNQIKAQGEAIKKLEKLVAELNAKLLEQQKAKNNLTEATKQLSSATSKESEATTKSAQSRKTNTQATKESTIENTKLSNTQKEVTKNTESTKRIVSQETREKAKSSVENRLLNKILRENAVILSKNSSAYQKLVVRMNQAGRVYQSLIAKKESGVRLSEKEIRVLRRSGDLFRKYEAAVKKADAAIGRHQRNVGNYSGALGKLRFSLMNIMSAFGVIGGVTLFANTLKSAFNLTRTLDSIGFAMRAVITDTQELADTQEWLRDITDKYGAELVTTTNRYIKFRAAAKQANFTAEETQGIFESLTKAAGVLGLKTDELQGIYLALEQMISKGKITTEELRRQLGERLPGAMDIMAQSMGVTTAELDKMMKKGEVITKDVLPGFAKQVEIAFGIENVENVKTLQAATTRLQNAWTNLVKDFGI